MEYKVLVERYTSEDNSSLVTRELSIQPNIDLAKKYVYDYIKTSFLTKDSVLRKNEFGEYLATDFRSYGETIIIKPLIGENDDVNYLIKKYSEMGFFIEIISELTNLYKDKSLLWCGYVHWVEKDGIRTEICDKSEDWFECFVSCVNFIENNK